MTTESQISQVDEWFGTVVPFQAEEITLAQRDRHLAITVQDVIQQDGFLAARQMVGNVRDEIPNPDGVYWCVEGNLEQAYLRMNQSIRAAIRGGSVKKNNMPNISSYTIRTDNELSAGEGVKWQSNVKLNTVIYDELGIAFQRETVQQLAQRGVPIHIDPLSYRILGLQVWDTVVQQIAELTTRLETLLKSRMTHGDDSALLEGLTRPEVAELIQELMDDLIGEPLGCSSAEDPIEVTEQQVNTPVPVLMDALQKYLPTAALGRMFPLTDLERADLAEPIGGLLTRCSDRAGELFHRYDAT